MVIYNRQDFDGGVEAGGATGSLRAKNKDAKWSGQVKNSISSASRGRRVKAGGLDTENFAELIGAHVARSVADDDQKHLVPEVSFVVDSDTQQVGVVSKYLDSVESDLLTEKVSKKFKDIQFVVEGEEQKNPEAFEKLTPEQKKAVTLTKHQKRSVCDGIALSILVGDHDINPGNFLKVNDKDGCKGGIARLDYGHAFNDLISQSRVFGGQVRNSDNQVLDYFNRERVNTIKLGDSTKLWRSFENLVPSEEMASSLDSMAKKSAKVSKGVQAAKEDFKTLLKRDDIDKKHVLSSLVQAANNTGKPKIKIDLNNIEGTVNKAFDKIQVFSEKQAKDMEKASKIMRAQLSLDKLIKKGVTKEGLADWKKNHAEIIGDGQNITWIKANKNTPAIKGSVETYIQKSLVKQGKTKEEIDKSIDVVRGEFPKPSLIQRVKNAMIDFGVKMNILTKVSEISVSPQAINIAVDGPEKKGTERVNTAVHSAARDALQGHTKVENHAANQVSSTSGLVSNKSHTTEIGG